jgi:chromosome segregation ATPase
MSATIGQNLLTDNEDLKREKENILAKLSNTVSENRFLTSRLETVENDLKISETSNLSILRSLNESRDQREKIRKELEGELKRREREVEDLKDEVEGIRKEMESARRREGKLKEKLEEEKKKRIEEGKELKILMEGIGKEINTEVRLRPNELSSKRDCLVLMGAPNSNKSFSTRFCKPQSSQ